MIVGRAADIPFQYVLFKKGYALGALVRVGLMKPSEIGNAALTTGPGILGLGPIPTLLLGMYTVSSLRHAYWVTVTNTMYFSASGAGFVSFYNSLMNTANTLLTAYTTSHLAQVVSNVTYADSFGGWAASLGWQQWVGLGLFTSGIAIEMLSEESRKAFKKDPKNKGRIDDTGLFGIVRHPNYLGYSLWRAGATLATGSVPAAFVTLLLQVGQFASSIPHLSSHMASKYGQQWKDYEDRVQYKVIPGVY
ncbi:hypothetical protein BD626DRAFT_547047 [Schizophyllum amplum]|uniref:Uncharacterized protein n=1 Tax=Schizophyllum amplum TaxID=97359 RepID=A0A550CLC6_9AGAR|nr:hypothetical protein BD626DRAFT_547047 [Auriculariopsis ampla]